MQQFQFTHKSNIANLISRNGERNATDKNARITAVCWDFLGLADPMHQMIKGLHSRANRICLGMEGRRGCIGDT